MCGDFLCGGSALAGHGNGVRTRGDWSPLSALWSGLDGILLGSDVTTRGGRPTQQMANELHLPFEDGLSFRGLILCPEPPQPTTAVSSSGVCSVPCRTLAKGDVSAGKAPDSEMELSPSETSSPPPPPPNPLY
ncbi:von Willebrand factor A domain-containing protein 3B [Platysternon megacephalum]|uniref:von Willebrand factor A domain-containing protein 3B n=1 Tax=Platysternon megacephalum TaxID=55544 RepID=A0A4D9EFP2_9SAUR|nr:von Willebrand factor A domain-containing protein 3B [Platysternon megacephalum]